LSGAWGRPLRAAIFAVAILIVASCAGRGLSPTPISAETASATAIANVASTIPAKVISTRLSTYGAVADGGHVVDSNTPVWAVRLSGSFEPPSCGPITAVPHPCPPPATSALILIDASTGAYVQGTMPAPD